nr:MAG TPA_asm: hypothetical protein [Caudoviricetes sp.]
MPSDTDNDYINKTCQITPPIYKNEFVFLQKIFAPKIFCLYLCSIVR